MNVLCLVHYPVFGGPHNRILTLEPLLAARGIRTVVALPEGPGNAADRLRAGGLEVIQAPLSRLRATRDPRSHARFVRQFPQDVRRLRRIIRAHEIELVVVGGLVNPHGAIAARLEAVPVLWQIVDTRTPPALRAAMMPVVSRLASVVMFGAESLIDAHPGARRLAVPSMVLRPAVDSRRFAPSKERRRATRQELGIPEQATVVGTVANLNPQKGIEHFLRAASLIERRRPGCWFVVVGAQHADQSAYLRLVHREVQASGVPSERMVFTGARSDVETIYPAFDVKMITSIPRSEGTTTTAIEAMSCGVPVVATDVGGIAEIVLDGVTGKLVPPLDPEALASQTLHMLDEPEVVARLGREGRKRVLSEHDLRVASKRYLDAYNRAIGIIHKRRRRRRGRRGARKQRRSRPKVAFFGMLPADNAATRTFCELPVRYLAHRGIKAVSFTPSSAPLHARFHSHSSLGRRLRAAVYWYGVVLPRRLFQLALALGADVIFVQRGLLRYSSLPFLEGAFALVGCRLLGRRMIYHLDDALYEVTGRRRIASRCRLADLVLTGNPAIAAFARAVNANVEILDGWIEVHRYAVKRHEPTNPVTIGYVGTYAQEHLAPIASGLAEVCSRTGSRLKVVSRNPVQLQGLEDRLDWERWTFEREFTLFQDFDIGIMPLADTAYNRAKEGYKLKEYMAAGLPIVCSPVGHNLTLIEPGMNGFFASSHEEWVASLYALVEDLSLRSDLGDAGRRLVEERYAAERQLRALESLLLDVAGPI